ncbi:MAG: T9SS type A sorting domain-containing protein, partial [Bacteroidales bacterium]|nr:T9SS type A sorting domain-containing protein [Bacteroidales bacterium]
VESNNQKNQIVVFPNPATDFLNIINQNPSDIVESIEIYDITGSCVLRPNANEAQNITITTLSQGLYFVKIITESTAHFTLKFVKK